MERVLVFMASAETKPMQYYLPEKPNEADWVSANLTPAALIELQAKHYGIPRPSRIIALMTEGARVRGDQLEAAFEYDGRSIPMTRVDIPDGASTEQLMEIVRKLLDAIPQQCELVVDITHGFRATPFVFSVALQYLTLLNPKVQVEGLYYGMAKFGQPTPIVNMKVYLDMLDWLYAARVFRDTFIPDQLVNTIGLATKEAGIKEQAMLTLGALRRFASAVDAALPLEMAEEAIRLRKILAEGLPEQLERHIPGAERLFGVVDQVANEFVPANGRVPDQLTDEELNRQAMVIDKLIEHGRIAQAVGLMREWTILKVIYENFPEIGTWPTSDDQGRAKNLMKKDAAWQDPNVRGRVERVRRLRNTFMHFGQVDNTPPLNLSGLPSEVKGIWTELKSPTTNWRLDG